MQVGAQVTFETYTGTSAPKIVKYEAKCNGLLFTTNVQFSNAGRAPFGYVDFGFLQEYPPIISNTCTGAPGTGTTQGLATYLGTFNFGADYVYGAPDAGVLHMNQSVECNIKVGITIQPLYATTIASYTNGVVTPVAYPTTYACVGYCKTYRANTEGALLYIPINSTPAAGVTLFISGNVTYTGDTCTAAEEASLEQHHIITSGSIVNTATGSSDTGGPGTKVDETDVCSDMNADGYDDDTGTACSILANQALDAKKQSTLDAIAAIGTGGLPSLFGNVSAFADAHGGFFALPQDIHNMFNPEMSCQFAFSVSAFEGFGGLNTTTDWCGFKASINPFMNFAMWVLTCFTCWSIYRKPSHV
jgi:hypothetical protein